MGDTGENHEITNDRNPTPRPKQDSEMYATETVTSCRTRTEVLSMSVSMKVSFSTWQWDIGSVDLVGWAHCFIQDSFAFSEYEGTTIFSCTEPSALENFPQVSPELTCSC